MHNVRRASGRQPKPCLHGERFSWTNKSSISYEIILLPNALSIKFEESNICFQVETFPIEKSCVSYLLETLYMRHGGTPSRQLVKTYVCGDNPWESKLIRTRCGHY